MNHNLGVVVQNSLGNFARTKELFKYSMKVFEETRDLLKNSKDEWKINFHDKLTNCYSDLWCHLLVQGKTTEALFTVERGRARALRDLMESNYGVSSSEDLIERMSRLRIAKETGDKELEGDVYFSLGLIYCAWENFEKANEFLEQALSKAKES